MSRRWGAGALLLVVLAAGRAGARPDPDAAMSESVKQKRDAARKAYEVAWTNYREGRVPEELVYRWSKRWLRAERELGQRPADQVAACAAHLERMIELERLVRRLESTRQVTIDAVSSVEYYRAEADLWLEQARAEEKKKR
jgi:hypothetical protein